jgi:hypothetical protein
MECPTTTRRWQPRLFDGAMDAVGEALHVVGRPPWGRAVTGKIQREDPPAGVDAVPLGQRGSPQAAIEGQAVEQHQRRPVI